MEPERPWSLEAIVAETRGAVAHLSDEVTELRHDFRRLDDRFFHMLMIQLATLAAALASVVTAVLSIALR